MLSSDHAKYSINHNWVPYVPTLRRVLRPADIDMRAIINPALPYLSAIDNFQSLFSPNRQHWLGTFGSGNRLCYTRDLNS